MSLNPLAALLLAGILIRTIYLNRENQMIALLSEEGGFLKWIFALFLVLWLANTLPKSGKDIIMALLGVAAVAVVLKSDNAIKQLSEFVKS